MAQNQYLQKSKIKKNDNSQFVSLNMIIKLQKDKQKNMNNVIIVFKDGELKLEVNVRDNRESIWLNHQQIAELFDCDVKTINKHISNVLKEKLNEQVVVAKFESTTKHGAIEDKTQTGLIDYFNLNYLFTIAVDYFVAIARYRK